MSWAAPSLSAQQNTGYQAPLAADGKVASAQLAQRSGTNFYYAFFFLSPARREALNAVYAYCRLIDDIVDEPGETADKAAALTAWRHELLAAFDRSGDAPTHPIACALQTAQRRFALRYDDALAVLRGCEMDLTRQRYQTWDDVYEYCYLVASSVGLLCIDLFGCVDPASKTYAIHLGRALQLTNILRDIREDALRDRLYLPLDSLAQVGLSVESVMTGRVDAEQRLPASRLLDGVSRRAREEFRLAKEAKPMRDRRALIPAEIMGGLYEAILRKVEARGVQGLLRPEGHPVKLSKAEKLYHAGRAALHSVV